MRCRGGDAGWAAARVATVAVLLAVAVIGLRARGAFSHQASSVLAGAGGTVVARVFAVAEGAGLVACVTMLALVLRRPRRRKPEDEAQEQYRPPLPWWARTAAGPAGLVDAATVAAAGVLVVARGTTRGQEPQPVRTEHSWRNRQHAPAVSTAEFPAYRKIAADLSWAQVSGRHYQYGVRPMLARLAAALDRPDAVAGDLAGPPDADGPRADLATLNRIVTRLEEDR